MHDNDNVSKIGLRADTKSDSNVLKQKLRNKDMAGGGVVFKGNAIKRMLLIKIIIFMATYHFLFLFYYYQISEKNLLHISYQNVFVIFFSFFARNINFIMKIIFFMSSHLAQQFLLINFC